MLTWRGFKAHNSKGCSEIDFGALGGGGGGGLVIILKGKSTKPNSVLFGL